MQKFGKWMGAGAIAVVATTLAGCGGATEAGNAVDGATSTAGAKIGNVANDAAAVTSNVANAAGDNLKETANAASNVAGEVGNTVAGATSNTVNAIGGMMKTADIKAKIIGAPSLNNPKNKIDVDSSDTTVTLSGSVQNAAQKTLAESIAKQNAGGRKVENKLTVSGGAPATTKAP